MLGPIFTGVGTLTFLDTPAQPVITFFRASKQRINKPLQRDKPNISEDDSLLESGRMGAT
jgi:hypothetical protein